MANGIIIVGKGNIEKSGGIATNIGVHFFDMLIWIFGDVKENLVFEHEKSNASGFLKLEKANVNWTLSVDYENIPEAVRKTGARTFRSLAIEDEMFEFSGGFNDLHTRIYENVLKGSGFKIEETRKSIQLVHDIRNQKTVPKSQTNID